MASASRVPQRCLPQSLKTGCASLVARVVAVAGDREWLRSQVLPASRGDACRSRLRRCANIV
eukprot:3557727-Alexandrium_andersonii.AAC.1